MKWTVGTKIAAGFAVAMIAIVIIGFTSYRNMTERAVTSRLVEQSHEVIDSVNQALSDLKDAETGQRGFIITGDTRYLEPFDAGSSAIQQTLGTLRTLTRDNPDQQRRLEELQPLVDSKLAELKRTIELRRDPANGFDAAVQEVRTDKGKQAMDDIRDLIAEMEKDERDMLQTRSTAETDAARLTRNTILYGSGLTFVVLGLAGFFITRNVADPLKEISFVAERIAAGDLNVNVAANGRGDEVGVLARNFNRMSESLLAMAKAAEEVAAGNLTVSIQPQSAKDVMGNALETMVRRLSELIGQVQKLGINVASSTTELAATAKQNQATANEISSTTTEIGATAKEISATSKELVKAMKSVAEVADETAELADTGQAGLARMDGTMKQIMDASGSINARLAVLSEKAGNINTVVTTITKVADQTNLLSLNAAIEAEKAGEYGRGFAVVATEIRRLADQTAAATSDIEQMVKEMQSAVSAGVMGMDKFSEEVRRGAEVVGQVSAQLTEIIAKVQTLTPSFETVNEGMQSQSLGAEQISEALGQLGEAAQQTVDSLKQSNAAIQQLTEVTAGLRSGVSQFKTE